MKEKANILNIFLFAIIGLLIAAIAFKIVNASEKHDFIHSFKYSINNNEVYVVEYIDDLKEYEIPASVRINNKVYPVTKIYDEAFIDSDIVNLKLPDTIDYIGEKAFYNCSSLKTVEIPYSVKYIGKNAFYNCVNVENIYYNSAFDNVTISIEGNLFNYIGTNIPVNVYLGEDVVNLPSYLFASSSKTECTHIDNVSFLGNKCTTIGSNVFENCDVKSVEFSDSVTGFGKNIFIHSSISEVYIGTGVSYLSDYMFCDCKNLQNIILPENIRIIGIRCFKNSGLISINLPKSTRYIGLSAFADTPLQIINFNGTKDEWGKIDINFSKSTEFMNAKIIYKK